LGVKLAALLEKIRRERGPFLVARLALRVRFPLSAPAQLPDGGEEERELLAACRALGYDPTTEGPKG
jgi:hypothetical protein